MDAAFVGKYSQKLTENSNLAPNNECILWHGTLKSGKTPQYGIIHIKFDGAWKTVLVHRLQYMLNMHMHYLDLDSDMDVSHRCHNSLCINPAHLSYEPRFINNNRMSCKGRRVCAGHAEYLPCLLDFIM